VASEAHAADAARTSIRERVRALAARLDRRALGDAWQVLLWTRLLVLALGIYTWLRLTPFQRLYRGPPSFDLARVQHAFDGWPLGGVFRAVFEPLSVWDSVQYLTIAHSGYASVDAFSDPDAAPKLRAAFFPLYPLLTRVSSLFVSSPGAQIVGAFLVSLVALLGALYLLHRLTTLELGLPAARPTLLVLAFFPSAFVLGAPYTESLFLFLSIGAFYAARTGHWAWAGIAAGAAAATRNSGLLLLIPLAVMYLWGPRADLPPPAPSSSSPPRGLHRLRPRYPLRRDVLWLALAPLGLAAFMAYLQYAMGDPLAWAHGQTEFHRRGALPQNGLWEAIRAAWDALHGHMPSYYDFGSLNVLNVLCFAGAAAGLVGVFRRLPLAYGLYALPLLVVPLTAPWGPQPLASIVRYVLCIFPLFMWLGAAAQARGRTELVVGAFAALFGVLFVQFASGLFAF
jgi:hypothetical protein